MENFRKTGYPIEKRIVQLHLMYPDTETYLINESETEIHYVVIVNKE